MYGPSLAQKITNILSSIVEQLEKIEKYRFFYDFFFTLFIFESYITLEQCIFEHFCFVQKMPLAVLINLNWWFVK